MTCDDDTFANLRTYKTTVQADVQANILAVGLYAIAATEESMDSAASLGYKATQRTAVEWQVALRR